MPLHVKGGGKSVKEVAVENPLSRGGHTHTRTHIKQFPLQLGMGFVTGSVCFPYLSFKSGGAVCDETTVV